MIRVTIHSVSPDPEVPIRRVCYQENTVENIHDIGWAIGQATRMMNPVRECQVAAQIVEMLMDDSYDVEHWPGYIEAVQKILHAAYAISAGWDKHDEDITDRCKQNGLSAGTKI